MATKKLPHVNVWVDNIYSYGCRTQWARLRGETGFDACRLLKAVQRDTGYTQRYRNSLAYRWGQTWNVYCWTPMIYSSRLCVYAEGGIQGWVYGQRTACV